ncbi:MAG: ABC transporter permease [Baekduia sp.]
MPSPPHASSPAGSDNASPSPAPWSTSPSILLADEPTGNLDSKTSEEIIALFKQLHAEGQTIVIVTHEEDIAGHAKRIVRLRDGRILSDSPTARGPDPPGLPAPRRRRRRLRRQARLGDAAVMASAAAAGRGGQAMIIFRVVFQTVFLAPRPDLGQQGPRHAHHPGHHHRRRRRHLRRRRDRRACRSSSSSEFASVGASKVWIFPRMPERQRGPLQLATAPHPSSKKSTACSSDCPSLERLTPDLGAGHQRPVRRRQQAASSPSRPSGPTWHEIEDRAIIQGRPFSTIDEEQRRPGLHHQRQGHRASSTSPASRIGTRISVGGRRFTIVGVVETKTVSPMFGGDEARTEVYIPFHTGLDAPPRARACTSSRPDQVAPSSYEDAKAEITFVMRTHAQTSSPTTPDTFGVEAIEQIIDQFKNSPPAITVFARRHRRASRLLVGGIGIMNIMLVSRQRTHPRDRPAQGRRRQAQPSSSSSSSSRPSPSASSAAPSGWPSASGARRRPCKLIPKSPLEDAGVPVWAIAPRRRLLRRHRRHLRHVPGHQGRPPRPHRRAPPRMNRHR